MSAENKILVHLNLNGNELKVNNGITWVQIVPVSGTITIE